MFSLVNRTQAGRAGGDNQEGKRTFHEHGTIADQDRIFLTIQLRNRCSAGHKRMEPTHTTASDGHEKERDHGRGIGDLGSKSRSINVGIFAADERCHDKPHKQCDQCEIELKTVDIVSW